MHYRQLLSPIAQAHASTVGRAAAAVNQGLVVWNWLVGAYVVEFEQGGEDRAKKNSSPATASRCRARSSCGNSPRPTTPG